MTATPVHPGTVVFDDGGGNTRSVPVDEVPESLRFAEGPGGRVPVVRVVARTRGDQREILEYGPGGLLLRTTLQTRPA